MNPAYSVPLDSSGNHADTVSEALTRLCGTLSEDSMATLLSRTALVRIRVGDTLYRQGEAGECLHVVLTGRLQVRVATGDGKDRIVAYPQPGDVVGEIALFSGAGRAATIVAVRDTTLGAISRKDIDDLVARHPEVFSNIARMIIARLTGNSGHIARRTGARTLMVVPLHRSSDIRRFGQSLGRNLLRFGSVLHLDSHSARQRFGTNADEEYGRFLDACENAYDFLLLEADPTPSPWSRICQGYADRIVLLADAAMEPAATELERWLFTEAGSKGQHAEIELVLTHCNGVAPSGTRNWLAARQAVRHHHVQQDNDADLARVARFLSGNAVALVLAGGGARGFAHLGVIRALHEAGVAIDAVGGASFGALVATGLARGLNDAESFDEQRRAFTCEDPLGDYTIPIMSLVRGEHLNQVLRKHLPMDIEDLWLPFFAVSSDLSANKVRVHDHGPLWQAIRASVSLPAILPPTLENGHLLIDGGVLNNLPIDVMRERMRGPIIAVDLAVEAIHGTEHTAIPSSLEYLKSRLLPGRPSIEAPTLSRVILQVTTMASRKEVQSARKLADLYLNPPLGDFDFLDWGSMREIAAAGYRHALPRIKEWLHQHPRHENRAGFMHSWQTSRAA
ncbi:MAG: cyclic nucleotide-binding and patatin-like phospholipase domain-containing protein [Rhodocyclaceae bacterium]|nr:cyclic nucleotide-binding and patatin-like phospholipase domain-containing protein [Rhodocyclaceae bacterium]